MAKIIIYIFSIKNPFLVFFSNIVSIIYQNWNEKDTNVISVFFFLTGKASLSIKRSHSANVCHNGCILMTQEVHCLGILLQFKSHKNIKMELYRLFLPFISKIKLNLALKKVLPHERYILGYNSIGPHSFWTISWAPPTQLEVLKVGVLPYLGT